MKISSYINKASTLFKILIATAAVCSHADATQNLTLVVGETNPIAKIDSVLNPHDPFLLLGDPGAIQILSRSLQPPASTELMNNKILLNDTDFDSLIVELAMASENRDIALNTLGIKNPLRFSLKESKGKNFSVREEGEYEFWILADQKDKDKIQGISIGSLAFSTWGDQAGGDWTKVGSIKLPAGTHKIQLLLHTESLFQKKMKPIVMSVAIISKSLYSEMYEKLKSKSATQVLSKSKDAYPEEKIFQILKEGPYQISAFLQPRIRNIPAISKTLSFSPNNPLWAHRESIKSETLYPVLFGNGFFEPKTFFYPLVNGIWHPMSNRGKLYVLNPLKFSVTGNVTLRAVSFLTERKIIFRMNNTTVHSEGIAGPAIKPSKFQLSRVKDIRELASYSGPVSTIKIDDLILKPGINELEITSEPGANFLNNLNPFGLAILDATEIQTTSVSADTGWENSPSLQSRWENDRFIIKDVYNNQNSTGWIRKRFPKIELNSFPRFEMEYTWQAPYQAMDIGFLIDTGRSNTSPIYITRTLPQPSVDKTSRFEIDLLDMVWQQDNTALNPKLIGLDLFPRKKWDNDLLIPEKASAQFEIENIEIYSPSSSIRSTVKEDIGASMFTGDLESFSLDKHANYVFIASHYKNDDSSINTGKLSIPLKKINSFYKFLSIPFWVQDTEYQTLKVFVQYDNDKDGKIDNEIPIGSRITLSNWTLKGDIKDQYYTYETDAPLWLEQCEDEASKFCNALVTKNGTPLTISPNGDYFFFQDINKVKDMVLVRDHHIQISLPRDQHPDEYKYEIFQTPVIEGKGTRLGYKAFKLDLHKIYDAGTNPVGLVILLQSRKNTNSPNPELHTFYISSPEYLIGENLTQNDISALGTPNIQINGIPFQPSKTEFDNGLSGVWYKGRTNLSEGHHELKIWEGDSLELRYILISPLGESGKNSTETDMAYEIKRISPTKYIATFNNPQKSFYFILDQMFNNNWEATIVDHNHNRTRLKEHFKINGYANGWTVPKLDIEKDVPIQIIMEYTPQYLLFITLTIMILSLSTCIGIFFYLKKRKN